MRGLILATTIAFCGCLPGSLRAQQETPPQTVTPVAAQDQIGRYQIIISTIGDQTFLLDTTNGNVWQLVRFPELKTEPMAWQSMLTINSAADYDALAKRYGKTTDAPP